MDALYLGMWLGSCILALHMATTHSVTLSMIGSYMPTGNVEGVGKLSGTAWSITDFLLGNQSISFRIVGDAL